MTRVEPSVSEWLRPIAHLLDGSHLLETSEVGTLVNDAVRPLGIEAMVYLVDREQRGLRALPMAGRVHPEPVPINTTLAGQAFMTVRPAVRHGSPDVLWQPMLDGSERLGVVEFLLPAHRSADDPAVRKGIELVAATTSYIVVAKASYGDTIRRVRRSQPVTVGGELLWRALPPLTFSTPEINIAAVLEPCYDVGGDAFDYAADQGVIRLGIFDAIGQGLTAALTSTLTLAAIRSARAAGRGLVAQAVAADQALTSQFGDSCFTTAILADLDLSTGEIRYINAGHPSAVLLRDHKVVAELGEARRTPLGVSSPTQVGYQALQPGDQLLLYTDGITEARDPDGGFFGLHRLLELTEHHAAAGLPAAETARRLSRDVLEHQSGQLDDDATLLVVEWRPPGER